MQATCLSPIFLTSAWANGNNDHCKGRVPYIVHSKVLQRSIESSQSTIDEIMIYYRILCMYFAALGGT